MVNIFITDQDPVKAARQLPDMLVPRMCLEAAEILCAAHWNHLLGMKPTPAKDARVDLEGLPPWRRSLGQRKHPAVLWAGLNRSNYDWVYLWYRELASEHLMRYAKRDSYCAAFLTCAKYLRENRNRFVKAPRSDFIITTEHLPIRELDISTISRYKVLMVYKYAYLYERNVRWTNVELPKWLHDERIHRWLRRHYGKPVRKLPTSHETASRSFSLHQYKQSMEHLV